MDLRTYLKSKSDSSDPIRNVLPLEHFATNQDLRFFLELFLTVNIREYIPTTADDNFYAAVGLNTKDKSVVLKVSITKLLQHIIPEQMYILAHEAAHLLLAHLIKVDKYENKYASNIAQDAVINSLLDKYYKSCFSMPTDKEGNKMGITIQSLIEQELLPKDFLNNRTIEEVTSDEIYELLKQQANQPRLAALDGQGRFDNHDTLVDLDRLPQEIREAIDNMIRNAKNSTYGNITGDFVRELLEIVRKDFPFAQVLDKILFKDKYDFNRPSRRIRIRNPQTGELAKTFFPRKRNIEFKVYAGIDVSGSCFDYAEDFLGYILALPEFEEVVYCDTEIKQIVKKGEDIPKEIKGNGGTDLNPMMKRFEEIEKKFHGNGKLNFIILTDGEMPELVYGPRNSKVIVFTTNNLVNFEGSKTPYINIQINPEEGGK